MYQSKPAKSATLSQKNPSLSWWAFTLLNRFTYPCKFDCMLSLDNLICLYKPVFCIPYWCTAFLLLSRCRRQMQCLKLASKQWYQKIAFSFLTYYFFRFCFLFLRQTKFRGMPAISLKSRLSVFVYDCRFRSTVFINNSSVGNQANRSILTLWAERKRVTSICTFAILLSRSLFRSFLVTTLISATTGCMCRFFYLQLAIDNQRLNRKKQHQNTKY